MFTGLIQNLGRIESLSEGHLRVSTSLAAGLKTGDSISVNGVCLTATQIGARDFSADLSSETLSRTTFAKLSEGTLVNLETPLLASQALGGHLVQGHIDAVAEIRGIRNLSDSFEITFSYPRNLEAYIAEKGSIAIDGVSLTVNSVESEFFTVMIIPHTWKATIFHTYQLGQWVNLEVDIFAKYIDRALKNFLSTSRREREIRYS